MKELNFNDVQAVSGGDLGAVGAGLAGARIGVRFGPWGALAGAAIGVAVYYLP